MMSVSGHARHWRRTRSLMLVMLALLVLPGLVIHLFAETLDTVAVLGHPVGYRMAAQASLVAVTIMLFVFVRRQDRIDAQHDVAED